MIISKTPYRISFFGGGSDFPLWHKNNYGLVISTSINKFIYISVRDMINFFNIKYRLIYSKSEEVNNLKELKHPVVPKLVKYLNYNNNFEIHYNGELPSQSGMGSSSSFVVGLMNAIINLEKKKITKKELALKSIYFEQKVLKESVGCQDHISSIYGGLNVIEFYPGGDFKVKKLSEDNKLINLFQNNLFLYYTGIQRTSTKIIDSFLYKINNKKEDNIKKIVDIAIEAKKNFNIRDLDQFGRLLNESWIVKKSLSNKISNSRIDDIYEYGIESGALGGKVLGAGGGGFILFYVPKKNQKLFESKLNNKLLRLKFDFEDKGSEIIFKK
jgi:D-glycero-alpha-D-manno-heptose-7-phosphate kinase